MSVQSSYSSRRTRTAGGITRTEEKSINETKTLTGGTRKEEKTLTVKKDGEKISEAKFTKEEKVPGISTSRTGTRALKDANDNNLKGESTGAEAAVDLKAEAAKRRQRTMMSIEQRMMEQKQKKAAEQRKRTQGRQAFKAQLESNAPARNASNKSSFKRSSDSNIDRLLRWTQILTSDYPGVEVTDFSGSWADGLALCAVLNSLCPGEFPLDQMSEDDRKVNLDLAFEFASKKGVPSLIDTSDILRSKNPEPKSMITYLHTIYKVLVADKAEKERSTNNEKA